MAARVEAWSALAGPVTLEVAGASPVAPALSNVDPLRHDNFRRLGFDQELERRSAVGSSADAMIAR